MRGVSFCPIAAGGLSKSRLASGSQLSECLPLVVFLFFEGKVSLVPPFPPTQGLATLSYEFGTCRRTSGSSGRELRSAQSSDGVSTFPVSAHGSTCWTAFS